MKFTAFNDKFRFIAGRNKQDPEKCLLPTIIFINTMHPAFYDVQHRGFVIAIGWWDYSIKIGLFF